MRPEFQSKTVLTISQALFTLFFLLFSLTLLNGYLLNLTGGYQASSLLVLLGVMLELPLVLLAARTRISVRLDALELAGFMLVVIAVWSYFVAASWPTLLPPTQSVDAARHYLQVLFTYPKGTLVSWYPAGGAFLAAMLSHWTGWAPLRVLHPTAAAFVALSAGAVYGIACDLLPRKPLSKIAALIAPALLFVPWSYFAGILIGEQYFYAQALAQYFVVAALWFIAAYAVEPRSIFLILLGVALLGTVVAYPYLVGLPVALFMLVVVARLVISSTGSHRRAALMAPAIFALLLIGVAVALQSGGILELASAQVATVSDVGEGGVASPSVETLGGPLFLLLALAGIPFAWRAGAQGKAVLGFFLAWLLQFVVLYAVQPFFQISAYRVDKTFYILVFPLALLGALLPAWLVKRWGGVLESSRRLRVMAFLAAVVVLALVTERMRPAVNYAPFTQSELKTALWAGEHLDTYQISYLEPSSTSAYWLAFGLWREAVPNEWYQWIPAGVKLGPATFEEWRHDPAWPQWVLVRDLTLIPGLEDLPVLGIAGQPAVRIIHRDGNSAVLEKEMPPPATAPKPAVATPWYYAAMIRLLGYDLPRTSYAPGASVALTTYTESIYPPWATVGWRMELVDAQGHVVSNATGDPFGNKYPLQRWPAGRYTTDKWNLPLPADLAPGVYQIQLGLYQRTGGESMVVHSMSSDEATKGHLPTAPLGKIKIPLAPPTAEELRAATPVQARIGDALMLWGYRWSVDRATRTVRLTLYWQGLASTRQDYTAFVHLLDPFGKILAQKDAQPLDARYPTSMWDSGEIIRDEYSWTIPEGASVRSIEIGMYSQPDLKRLPVGTDDHVVLDAGF